MSKKTIQPCNFLTAKYGTEGVSFDALEAGDTVEGLFDFV